MPKDFSMEQKIDILLESVARIEEHLFVFKEQINGLNGRFDKVDERFIGIEQRLDYHEAWLKRIDKNLENCATKSEFGYLANRFNDLVGILEKNQVVSKYDAKQVVYSNPNL